MARAVPILEYSSGLGGGGQFERFLFAEERPRSAAEDALTAAAMAGTLGNRIAP
jgi:hypothetical protein